MNAITKASKMIEKMIKNVLGMRK